MAPGFGTVSLQWTGGNCLAEEGSEMGAHDLTCVVLRFRRCSEWSQAEFAAAKLGSPGPFSIAVAYRRGRLGYGYQLVNYRSILFDTMSYSYLFELQTTKRACSSKTCMQSRSNKPK